MKNTKLLLGLLAIVCWPSFAHAQTGNSYIPYRNGNKWGYCNGQKEIVISPVFDSVGMFWVLEQSNLPPRKYAFVMQRGRLGMIDTMGMLIIPCQYDLIIHDYAYVFYLTTKAQWYKLDITDGFVRKVNSDFNKEGLKEMAIPSYYPRIFEIRQVGSDRYNVIMKTLQWAKDEAYYLEADSSQFIADTVFSLSGIDSVFIIQKNRKYGLISYRNRFLVQPEYDYAEILHYVKKVLFRKEKEWMLFTVWDQSKKIICQNADVLEDLGEPVFLAKKGSKYGLVHGDSTSVLTEYIYDSVIIGYKYGNYLAGKRQGKWYVVEKENAVEILGSYNDIAIDEYSKSIFLIKQGKNWNVFVDKMYGCVYAHPKPFYRYMINQELKLIQIYAKDGSLLGYASFSGINYWD